MRNDGSYGDALRAELHAAVRSSGLSYPALANRMGRSTVKVQRSLTGTGAQLTIGDIVQYSAALSSSPAELMPSLNAPPTQQEIVAARERVGGVSVEDALAIMHTLGMPLSSLLAMTATGGA